MGFLVPSSQTILNNSNCVKLETIKCFQEFAIFYFFNKVTTYVISFGAKVIFFCVSFSGEANTQPLVYKASGLSTTPQRLLIFLFCTIQ